MTIPETSADSWRLITRFTSMFLYTWTKTSRCMMQQEKNKKKHICEIFQPFSVTFPFNFPPRSRRLPRPASAPARPREAGPSLPRTGIPSATAQRTATRAKAQSLFGSWWKPGTSEIREIVLSPNGLEDWKISFFFGGWVGAHIV